MSARAAQTRAVLARLIPAAAMAGLGLTVAAGGLGTDYRGLGVLALSELVVTTGLRLMGWLAGRPMARAGLRLGAAALAVTVAGTGMPSAPLVASLFLGEGVLWLGWVALHWRGGGDALWLRAHLRLGALVAGVGLWFLALPLPPSGWSPVVGVLLGGAALSSRARPAGPVEEEC